MSILCRASKKTVKRYSLFIISRNQYLFKAPELLQTITEPDADAHVRSLNFCHLLRISKSIRTTSERNVEHVGSTEHKLQTMVSKPVAAVSAAENPVISQ